MDWNLRGILKTRQRNAADERGGKTMREGSEGENAVGANGANRGNWRRGGGREKKDIAPRRPPFDETSWLEWNTEKGPCR